MNEERIKELLKNTGREGIDDLISIWKKMVSSHHHAVQDIIWQRKADSQFIALTYMRIF